MMASPELPKKSQGDEVFVLPQLWATGMDFTMSPVLRQGAGKVARCLHGEASFGEACPYLYAHRLPTLPCQSCLCLTRKKRAWGHCSFAVGPRPAFAGPNQPGLAVRLLQLVQGLSKAEQTGFHLGWAHPLFVFPEANDFTVIHDGFNGQPQALQLFHQNPE
jgi:hypothetical protein